MIRLFAFSVVTLLAVLSGQAAELFFGEIPIQYVGPGEKEVLDLHRFLHRPDANVHVDSSDVFFDPKAFTLALQAKCAGVSPSKITAELNGHKITRLLVLAVEPALTTRITFKPIRPAQKVSMAGKFNNWNANATATAGNVSLTVPAMSAAFISPAGNR